MDQTLADESDKTARPTQGHLIEQLDRYYISIRYDLGFIKYGHCLNYT